MNTDFQLIQKDKIGSVIGIIGYIFAFIAANQAESELISEKYGNKGILNNLAAQTAAIATMFLLISLIIRGGNAFVRLYENQEQLMKGEEVNSIIPNIYTTSGFALGIMGNTLRLVGALMRANE
ncbi:hypothetical protein [Clostridium thermarum]|uniref:hypothetical protein n=1 Tax=Clostridium thermarum TaxID=1716543 RepID=UPI0013D719E0|nr:hypothetical protein [Clostridium thermarum]